LKNHAGIIPEAIDFINNVKKANKRLIFFTNAPRVSDDVKTVLYNLGIDAEIDNIISCGEVFYRMWNRDQDIIKKRFNINGNKVYAIGMDSDNKMVSNLGLELVLNINQADFLMIFGTEHLHQQIEDFRERLNQCAKRSLVAFCLNPDFVVPVDSESFAICAGSLAQYYESIGGIVYNTFGKPHPSIYEYAMNVLRTNVKSEVIAIGDSIATDITGASNFGIASALVMTGIHAHHEKNIFHILSEKGFLTEGRSKIFVCKTLI